VGMGKGGVVSEGKGMSERKGGRSEKFRKGWGRGMGNGWERGG